MSFRTSSKTNLARQQDPDFTRNVANAACMMFASGYIRLLAGHGSAATVRCTSEPGYRAGAAEPSFTHGCHLTRYLTCEYRLLQQQAVGMRRS